MSLYHTPPALLTAGATSTPIVPFDYVAANPPFGGNMKPVSPIIAALNAESYQYLSTMAPELLGAVETEIAQGRTPEQIKRVVAAHLGPDREALAQRVFQAAMHVERTQRG